jgi:hypothetical protein
MGASEPVNKAAYQPAKKALALTSGPHPTLKRQKIVSSSKIML